MKWKQKFWQEGRGSKTTKNDPLSCVESFCHIQQEFDRRVFENFPFLIKNVSHSVAVQLEKNVL